MPYGSFAGKTAGTLPAEVALYATVSVMPALLVGCIDLAPALSATAEVSPALRARVRFN